MCQKMFSVIDYSNKGLIVSVLNSSSVPSIAWHVHLFIFYLLLQEKQVLEYCVIIEVQFVSGIDM